MTYKPETLDALAERGFKAIQDAYNSGYILGNENAEARIIELLEDFQYYGMSHELNDEFCRQLIVLIKGKAE